MRGTTASLAQASAFAAPVDVMMLVQALQQIVRVTRDPGHASRRGNAGVWVRSRLPAGVRALPLLSKMSSSATMAMDPADQRGKPPVVVSRR